MKYLLFLNYLIHHKWYVFLECCRYGVPWRGICHDISKFLPGEFTAYANYYYDNFAGREATISPMSLEVSPYYPAWLIHQQRNRHHWQGWILHQENSNMTVIPMPDQYIKEMVADWRGAGKAQGQPDTMAWYKDNRDNIVLHAATRIKVEQLLQSGRILNTEYVSEAAATVRNRNLKTADNLQ
jgi:hypothetical protein